MMKYYIAILLALSVLIGPDGNAVAQDKSPAEQKSAEEAKPEAEKMPDAPAQPPQRSRTRRRLDPRTLRTSPAMRDLFHDVIEKPSHSVVEVYADGERVCLGTIVSADGHIATKASLAKGTLTCRLRDVNERIAAELVGADNDYDLAILKIDRKDLTPIEWSSKKYELGSFVASPNIEGDAHAIGVMSVQLRRFNIRQSRSNTVEQQRGFLGVMTVATQDGGVRLQRVVEGSGAAAAGLKPNDVMTKVNDTELKQPQDLFTLLRTLKPNDKVKVEIQRGDESLNLTVTLGKVPAGNSRSPMDRWGGGPFSERRFNFPEVLAHDSVVAPNNIGGPLVDSYGNVIGLNVARALRVTTYAIAANDVQRLVKKIAKLDSGSPAVASADRSPDPIAAAEKIRAAGIDGTVLLTGKGAVADPILASFVRLSGGSRSQLVILQTGQGNEDDSLRLIEQWWISKGASVSLLRADDPTPEQRDHIGSMLKTANSVWVDAAESESLVPLMGEASVTDAITAILKRGGIVGGSAAFSEVVGKHSDKTSKTEFTLIPQTVVTTDVATDDKPLASTPGKINIQLAPGAAIACRGRRLTSVGTGSVSIRLAATKSYPEEETVSLAGRSRTADLTALRRLAIQRTMPVFPAAKVAEPKVAAGTLMIIGGGGMPRGALGRFVKAAGGSEAKIVVIPISTPDPLPEQDRMAAALKQAGAAKVTVLRGRTPEAANDAASIEALSEATGVWFGGGRQWRFVDAYEGTKAYDLMHDVLKRGGIIGGSSAGASIQGEYLARGNPLGSTAIMAPGYERGFSFLPGVAIDQHFSQRRRFNDMKSLMARYPQFLGIGIDESTAIVVTGNVAEVIGRTRVCFYDGVSEDDDFTSVEAGQRYDLVERKILSKSDKE